MLIENCATPVLCCPIQTGSYVHSDLDKAVLFNTHFNSVNVDYDGNLPEFPRRAESNTMLDIVQNMTTFGEVSL